MTWKFFLALSLAFSLHSLSLNAQTDTTAGGTFRLGTPQPTPRMGASTVHLPDGRILVVGGHGSGFVSLNNLLIYQNGGWTSVALPYPADASTVARLQDGRILIFGGSSDLGIPAYNNACVFNPATNQVVSVGNLNLFRASSGAATLLDGRVLAAGAWWVHNNAHTQAEIYNPATSAFSLVGALNIQRALPLVIPTSDSGAVVIGGTSPTGNPISEAIERFARANGSFSILRNSLIPNDTGWTTLGVMRPIDEMRLNDGRYVIPAYRNQNNVTERALIAFNPTTLAAERLNVSLPASAEIEEVNGVFDRARQTLYLLYVSRNNPRLIRVYAVHLPTLQRNDPTGWHDYGAYPFYATFAVLPNGELLLSGGTTDGSNFNPTDRTVIIAPNALSHREPLRVERFALRQNYPNPFNPTTTIQYQLPVASAVSLKVHDALGREVATLVNAKQSAGEHAVTFDATRLASGVYFYRLQAVATSGGATFVQTKKMMFVK